MAIASHYLLWEYEEHIQPKGYKIGSVVIESDEIEHISPKTPTDGKPLVAGYEVNDQNQYSEDFVKNHLNSIGNLLLISKTHNTSIGNAPFADKLKSYKLTTLLKQQTEIDGFLVNEKVQWHSEQIEKRKAKILKFAHERWNMTGFHIEGGSELFWKLE